MSTIDMSSQKPPLPPTKQQLLRAWPRRRRSTAAGWRPRRWRAAEAAHDVDHRHVKQEAPTAADQAAAAPRSASTTAEYGRRLAAAQVESSRGSSPCRPSTCPSQKLPLPPTKQQLLRARPRRTLTSISTINRPPTSLDTAAVGGGGHDFVDHNRKRTRISVTTVANRNAIMICVGSSVDCPSSPSAAAHALPTVAATAIGADRDSECSVDRSRQPARLTVSTVASR